MKTREEIEMNFYTQLIIIFMVGFAMGLFVMVRSIKDGSIPECNQLLTNTI